MANVVLCGSGRQMGGWDFLNTWGYWVGGGAIAADGLVEGWGLKSSRRGNRWANGICIGLPRW